MVENQAPVRVERYSFVPDSGGAGQWRGGLSVERQLRFLGRTATLQLRSDRRDHPPYGLAGGRPGAPSSNALHDGKMWRELPTKFTRPFNGGEAIRHRSAGGGGYGDPLDRAPEAVLADVREGKVTVEAAARDYGVAVLARPWRVDARATAEMRRARRLAPAGEAAGTAA
jgi:N-methylhydantoinase B